MSEITYFVALPFDLVDGGLAAGEPASKAVPTGMVNNAHLPIFIE
jgi:hypothetical protein